MSAIGGEDQAVLPRRAKDSDTDPSTPEALRGPGVDTNPGLGPGGRAASTNPGLGGPAGAPRHRHAGRDAGPGSRRFEERLGRAAPRRDAPAAAPAPAHHPADGGPVVGRLPRRALGAAGPTSPDDMPKVVVERAPQHATVRLDRARLQAVIEQAHAEKTAQAQQLEQAQRQGAGMPMSLRIAIAIVAGLAVVPIAISSSRDRPRTSRRSPHRRRPLGDSGRPPPPALP